MPKSPSKPAPQPPPRHTVPAQDCASSRSTGPCSPGRFPLAAALTAIALAPPALAQIPSPDYGFHWETIGAVGNAPYSGYDPNNMVTGLGQVNYEYRISQLEVTTAQWMEFVNTFSVQPELTQPGGPDFVWGARVWWGAVVDPTYTGPGIRWALDPGEQHARMIPVNGISWRSAALFCNWLNNGKPSQWSAIQNGAYDASTFISHPDGSFDDQRTHNPGARFWIPTLDEWLKAAHYDPNRYGPGEGGWWTYSTSSDTPPVPGLPGVGQTTAGLDAPGLAQLDVPLGAYPDVRSPWGLLDTSGGASEWTEGMWYGWRMWDGSRVGPTDPGLDAIWSAGADLPASSLRGLRIASSIPAPGTSPLVGFAWVPTRRRRRRLDFSSPPRSLRLSSRAKPLAKSAAPCHGLPAREPTNHPPRMT